MSKTLRVGSLAILAALGAGCGAEPVLSQTEGELEVSPPLLDLGVYSVGESISFPFQVDHLRGGTMDIRNVVVTNVEGNFFSYVAEEGIVQLEPTESIDLPFLYFPQNAGYHRAKVSITHTGKDSPTEVEVRARAVVPEVIVAPLGLDFGPVAVGDRAQLDVLVSNGSDLDLILTEAVFSNPVFSLGDTFPVTVGAGDDRIFSVVFQPTTDQPATGTLSLKLGDAALPEVSLRGNDCRSGEPEAYDRDDDGMTTCAGDCDDLDPNVRPGLPEEEDGVDQDCDGDIDEGTPSADDDGDGFCEGPTCTDGSEPGDCHDAAPGIHPDASERPDNGIDDDCDGVVDAGTSDRDGDHFSEAGGDCDDDDAGRFPGAAEVANRIDDDCDGVTDEGTTYFDDDGDRYCEGPVCSDGSTPGDCDDDVADLFPVDGRPDGRGTHPGAAEAPDWRDNDCDGRVDEGTINADDDGDGFTEVGGDCDDADPGLSPGLGTC